MASSSSCFSLVSLYSSYISRCLSVAGLSSQTIDIDDQTTIQFWGPKPPSNSNSNSNSNSDSDSNSALAKPALVLIHGFGPEAKWQWRLQASFFARRNFAVYIPNLVFFGGSTTRSPDRSEVFQAISVGKLLERLGIERYSVAGTSYGGFVAYHMARMWPERVERVVIASSGVNMKRRDNEELASRAKLQRVENLMLPGTAAQLRTLVSLAISRPPRLMPDFFLNDILRGRGQPTGTADLGSLGEQEGEDGTPAWTDHRKGRHSRIKPSPAGRVDCVGRTGPDFPAGESYGAEAVRIEVLGEKAKLEVIEKASHLPQIEQPARFNHILNTFLCGSSSSSSSC